MKVRWTRNSVRLRITPTELASLANGECVCERFTLPSASSSGHGWSVTVEPIRTNEATELRMEEGGLRLRLAPADRAHLLTPEVEGVYFCLGGDEHDSGVRYFIEKDFPCLHPRAMDAHEPETETFEAPAHFVEDKSCATSVTA